MAGFDDYKFYTKFKEQDSPFWQKTDQISMKNEADYSISKSQIQRSVSHNTCLSESSEKIGSMDATKRCATNMQVEKYGEVSIMIINICAENLLSHPFIVLRRQSQVNVFSQRYHLTPFTLIPSIIHIQSQQGISAFWKGLGSVMTVRGVNLAVEDCISKFTPWPKEISPYSSLKKIGQHLLLKSASLAIVTPFYSASLVETVQSEVTSERPGVLDVFKEGFWRLLSFTQPQTGRLLPVWMLIMPTVLHGIGNFVIGSAVTTLTSRFLKMSYKRREENQGALNKDSSLKDASIKLQSAFMGHMVADVILFPLETVLHRCHLQGTRTIIDSLDVGNEVKPILTQYEGFFDCLATTIKDEGFSGLFKGFGALCLQYALYGAVLKFAHVIITEISIACAPPLPQPKIQGDFSPLARGAPYGRTSSNSASLNSSPAHINKRQHSREMWHHGSVDLADLPSSSPVDLRGEVYKYKNSLYNDMDNVDDRM